MSWFKSRSTAYESNEEHLREELDRIAGLLRAQLLRFQLARPEAHRERFWHLTDDYLTSLARENQHSPLALFEPAAETRELLDWAAARRADIDQRIAATRKCDLRLPRLAREFGLLSEETDALLVALLPSLHSTYRHWFGILQHDAARTQATVGLIIEMLAKSSADHTQLFRMLAPSGKLA